MADEKLPEPFKVYSDSCEDYLYILVGDLAEVAIKVENDGIRVEIRPSSPPDSDDEPVAEVFATAAALREKSERPIEDTETG